MRTVASLNTLILCSAALGLALVLPTRPGLAQQFVDDVMFGDDVIFVDDLEQSLRNRPASSPPASQQRSLGQSTRRQPPRTAPSEKPEAKTIGWREKLSFNSPFGKFFGDNQEEQTAASRQPAPRFAGTTSSQSKSIQPNRASSFQTRQQVAGNQPRGLFQLGWGATTSSSQPPRPEQLAQQAIQPRQPSQSSTAPQKPTFNQQNLPLAMRKSIARPQPTAPAFDPSAQIAMVSDMDAPQDIKPKQPSNVSRVAKWAPTTNQSLPVVTGPPAAAPAPTNVARALQPVVPVQHQTAAATAHPLSGPVEIVNKHARPISRTQRVALGSPVRLRPTTPSTGMPNLVVTSPATNVPMPKNPVAPKPITPEPPSEKAVELLANANRLSQSATTEDEYTEVVQICRHVLAIDNTPTAIEYSHALCGWALNRRGEIKADEGRDKEALIDFNDALQLDPNRWRAIHNRAVLAAQSGQFEEAFDDFNRTLKLNPKFAKAYSNRATLYVQAKQLDFALEDYRLAIDNDPDLAVAHKGRGRVCHMLGDFQTALQHFDAATQLAPSDSRIVNLRGDLLTDMGRYRAAEADYRRAIELDSDYAVAYRSLAWLQATCPDRSCRDAQAALENAAQAMDLTEELTDLEYDTLAAAQAASGDYAAAEATMDKAIAIARPADTENYQWRRQLYERGQPYVTEPASSIQQASYAQ